MPKAKSRNPLVKLFESAATTRRKANLRSYKSYVNNPNELSIIRSLLNDPTNKAFLAKHPKTNAMLRDAYLAGIATQTHKAINEKNYNEIKQFITQWNLDEANRIRANKNPQLNADLQNALDAYNKAVQNSNQQQNNTQIKPPAPPPNQSPRRKSTDVLRKMDAMLNSIGSQEIEQESKSLQANKLIKEAEQYQNNPAEKMKRLSKAFDLLTSIEKLSQPELTEILTCADKMRQANGDASSGILILAKALQQINKAESELSQINIMLLGKAYLNLAQLSASQDQHNNAVRHFMDAAKMFRRIAPPENRDKDLIAQIYSGLIQAHANSAAQTSDKSQALEQLNNALSVLAKHPSLSDDDLRVGARVIQTLKSHADVTKAHNILTKFASSGPLKDQTAISNLLNRENKAVAANFINQTLTALVLIGRKNLSTATDKTQEGLTIAANIYKTATPLFKQDPGLLQTFSGFYQSLIQTVALLKNQREMQVQEAELLNRISSTATVAKELSGGNTHQAQENLIKRGAVSVPPSPPPQQAQDKARKNVTFNIPETSVEKAPEVARPFSFGHNKK